jgi:hypothetical protein
MIENPDPQHEDSILIPTASSLNGAGPVVSPFEPPPVVDPWDPDYLAVSSETVAHNVRTILPVRKPPGEGKWFRASDNPAHAIQLLLFKDTHEGDLEGTYYLVRKEVESLLVDVSRPYLVALCRGLRSGPFFWPIPLPLEGREASIWTTSALRTLDGARREWIRRIPSNEEGYQFAVADEPDALPPVASFPKEPMRELLMLAFKGCDLNSVDHPVVAKIRGRRVRKPA